jgi:hypothetical protein
MVGASAKNNMPQYQAVDNPEEFSGQRVVELASYNDIPLAMHAFDEA